MRVCPHRGARCRCQPPLRPAAASPATPTHTGWPGIRPMHNPIVSRALSPARSSHHLASATTRGENNTVIPRAAGKMSEVGLEECPDQADRLLCRRNNPTLAVVQELEAGAERPGLRLSAPLRCPAESLDLAGPDGLSLQASAGQTLSRDGANNSGLGTPADVGVLRLPGSMSALVGGDIADTASPQPMQAEGWVRLMDNSGWRIWPNAPTAGRHEASRRPGVNWVRA